MTKKAIEHRDSLLSNGRWVIGYFEDDFHATPEGGCFPHRPYFPIALANGTDSVLIGMLGSMESHGRSGYTSTAPTFHTAFGWYKTARKDFDFSNMTYGHSICLADGNVELWLGRQAIAIQRSHQAFNPTTGIITTEIQQLAQRSRGQLRLRITTFLMEEHVLVEHYEVLEVPPEEFALRFNLGPAVRPFQYDLCTRVNSVKFMAMTNGHGFLFEYTIKKYHGVAATWVDLAGGQYRAPSEAIYDKRDYRPHTFLSPPLAVGTTLTRYLAVIDNEDTPQPRAALDEIIHHSLARNYAATKFEHIQQVQKNLPPSSVTLPVPGLQHIYDTSKQLLAGLQEPQTGFLPMGILPYLWENAMFWDSWFAAQAWLGANDIAKAYKLASFWKGKLPEARALAARLGYPGARFAWTTQRDHFTLRPENCVQFHNNAVIALQLLQTYSATGDVRFLSAHIEVIEDALLFLVTRLLTNQNGKFQLQTCAGIDESTTDQKLADTWTLAVICKAINEYLAAIGMIPRPPFQNNLPEIRNYLWNTLNSNIDEACVLQSFSGGCRPHLGSLIFALFPEHPACRATLQALSQYDQELDAFNSHGVINYHERIFTWTEYWTAWIQAVTGNSVEGWRRLRQAARFTDRFGGIPERIFYDGLPLMHNFLTAHATFMIALHNLLIRETHDTLILFDGLPEDFHEIAFANLRTPNGLQVSARFAHGRCQAINVYNAHTCKKTALHITAPGLTTNINTLGTGESWTWQH